MPRTYCMNYFCVHYIVSLYSFSLPFVSLISVAFIFLPYYCPTFIVPTVFVKWCLRSKVHTKSLLSLIQYLSAYPFVVHIQYAGIGSHMWGCVCIPSFHVKYQDTRQPPRFVPNIWCIVLHLRCILHWGRARPALTSPPPVGTACLFQGAHPRMDLFCVKSIAGHVCKNILWS